MMKNIAKQIVVAVDDDFRLRESLASHEPVVFSSAEEFLQSGTLAAATCAITDVRMSGMGGIELQHRIRLVRPTLPVIFITAHTSSDEIRQKAIEEGAVDFLYEPYDAAELLEAIQAAPADQSVEMGTISKGAKRWLSI